ncbi:MAG: heme-dependent oxidative N-demethylase subunit alpha family protein [Betaproteobacteria bacterium]
MSAFDFDAAVQAPFRMQPGMRRLAAGSPQLTPLAPGSRHQREKLAVLSAFWPQALVAAPGFDAGPALDAVAAHAAAEHPGAWAVGPESRWHARHLDTAVQADGTVEQLEAGRFGLGDEVARCLRPLPAAWRRPALLALAFAEDLAVVNAADGRIPWIAVCLPSHWAPAEKVGRAFAEVHAPVADNALLLQAGAALMRLASGGERWERFVWNVTDHPRLNAHPAHQAPDRWAQTAVAQAWFRSERQTFIPVPGQAQAVFTILVDVQPLAATLDSPARAQALHDAIASMSAAVLAYRGLAEVREPLLQWLQAHAARLAATDRSAA